ncbi:tyrosine-type recombinase/integrase [Chitinophaga sp. RCC_12]|uniref:tyrosine-type recombinase/integrase n=1 Tax=Chitinophaga sp. RCC_12 TaxID=3239226 RepID=UPI0035232BB3
MSNSIGIVLDKRRIKTNEKYPLKLRVRLDGNEVEMYSTIYDLSEEDYNKLSAPRISDSLKEIKQRIKEIETDSRKFISDYGDITFQEFERDFIKDNPHFKKRRTTTRPEASEEEEDWLNPYRKRFKILKEPHPGTDYISYTFQKYIKQLLAEGRIGSALNYQDAYYSLKRFRGNVQFETITVSYLHQYERMMIDIKGRSKTTVGIKLRSLRSVFNEAIEDKIIKGDKCYPFGKRKYKIPTSRNIKKALDISEVQSIYEFKPENEFDRKARDYWLFSYLCNGLNPKDFAYLKYRNIDEDYIIFTRAKTERETRNDPKLITAYITEDMHRIINEWGNKDRNPNSYIFPVLVPGEDLLKQHMRVCSLAKFICDGMKNVVKALGIKKKAGNAECRHTTATTLKRSGATTEFIQEILGHHNKNTTENYLDSFENDVKKQFAKKLTQFK